MQNNSVRHIGLSLMGLLVIGGCATSGEQYKQEYARIWKETIKSEAWHRAIAPSKDDTDVAAMDYYASTEEIVLDDNATLLNNFSQKYNKLVSRAYFKIIEEAEKADRRLKKEYELLHQKNANPHLSVTKTQKGSLTQLSRKYEAHRAMLEGLKSWNIMSDYGSDDLEFFQAEHYAKVTEMLSSGQSEANIVAFLVYKLADLYHFEQ